MKRNPTPAPEAAAQRAAAATDLRRLPPGTTRRGAPWS